jgi:PIN domain nuclease of toxin-antitoxin system
VMILMSHYLTHSGWAKKTRDDQSMKLLLDTHAFLWLASDITKLSPNVQRLLSNEENEIYLSVASLWEMSIKLGMGKLHIGKPLAQIVIEQQQVNHIQLLAIHASHALAVQELPPHHKDPFDRMLVAQARLELMTLLTEDATLKLYPVAVEW